jgi:hypothetical protein
MVGTVLVSLIYPLDPRSSVDYHSARKPMGTFRYGQMICLAAFLACVGCRSRSASAIQSPSVAHGTPQAGSHSVSAPSNTAESKIASQRFGFSVTSVYPELCCSDTPGKPSPDGMASVEGVTPDNIRFALSCTPDSYKYFIGTSGKIPKSSLDRWYEMHTASIGSDQFGNTLAIYSYDYDLKSLGQWAEFAHCSVMGRLDRAKNEFPILVNSSRAGDWKDGSGYELSANSRNEVFTLKCLQNKQSPCVSVAPATYKGIRDGSEIRLCDQDLAVIATLQIVDERSLR